MRILAIRGKNLASLAGEFGVDFMSEPLASAGLYAITGPTGSGKSTLLDALCLALYDATPRLARATGRGVDIPDVASEVVQASDPKTLLRRGASEGYAEVDFAGSDGVGWRARWSVRRARSRADGKLQASDLQLHRIDDGTRIDDGRKKETLKLIEARIGLGFEQFTRAVLLAQNDFATFLKASDDERAALLQVLTGSATYTRLSQAAHARARKEGDALAVLEARLADVSPLPADERTTKEAELATTTENEKTLEKGKAELEGHLRWHAQGRELANAEAAAQQKYTDDARLVEEAKSRRDELDLADAVAAAKPLHAEKSRLAQEAMAGEAALSVAEAAKRKAEQALADAATGVEAAQKRLGASRQAKQAELPNIERARQLEAQLAALQPGLDTAAKAHQEATRELAALSGKLAAQEKTLAGNTQALAQARDWLAGHASLAALAPAWPGCEALLGQAGLQRAGIRSANDRQVSLKGAAEQAASTWKMAEAEVVTLSAAYQEARQRADAIARQCAAFRPEENARQRRDSEARRDRIDGAERLLAALNEQQASLAELERKHREQQTENARCQAVLEKTTKDRPLVDRDLEQAERALHAAELAASENVGHLRAGLEDGQPCPVCGATDHPWVNTAPALDAVLATLHKTLASARNAQTRLLQEMAAADAGLKTSRASLATVAGEIDAASRRLAATRADWQAHPLATEWATIDTDSLPGWLAGEKTGAIAATEQAQAAEKAWHADCARRDAAQADCGKKQAALDSAREKLGAAALARQKLDGELAVNAAALATATERLEALQLEVDARLESGWREAWEADSQAFVRQRKMDVEAWNQRSQQASELAAAIGALESSVHGAREAAALATGRVRQREAELAARTAELRSRQQELALIFGGKTAATAEAELDSAIEAASLEATRRQDEHRKAALAVAEQAATAAQHAQRLGKCRDDLARASTALTSWLAAFNAGRPDAAPLESDRLAALLAQDPDALTSERAALQALETRRSTAEALWREQVAARQRHEAARTSTETQTALQEALRRVAADLEATRVRLAGLRAELLADDEKRRQSAQLVAQSNAQREASRVWGQLDDLIGSADGKKFRNFAQQMTLDVLLAYANRHLESLSRRYRLQRIDNGLGLLVVDLDMGEEVRSVHSLSGGESFLVSLALALGLASLSSHRVRVESLFIDEGFGSLDADSLSLALDALDSLQAQGRKVGVISHVQEMNERIGTRIEVRRLAGGQSRVTVSGAGA